MKKYKQRDLVAVERPDLVEEWLEEPLYNGTPYTVTVGSDKVVSWCCKECNFIWKTQVKNRALHDTGCPKCMERYNVAFPEMVIYFYLRKIFGDTVLNSKIDNIAPYDFVDVYIPTLNLIIEYDGGLTHAGRYDIDLQKSELIIEQGYILIRIRDNDLLPLNIDGIEEYLYKRDSNKSIQEMLNHLLDILIYKFKEQRPKFESIRNFLNVDSDNMAILSILPPIQMKINPLLYFPQIKDIWDYNKNSLMEPQHFKPYSNHKALFKCEIGHSYIAQIGSKTKGHGCPYCEGQLATKTNNLAVLFPDIAKEWNFELNQKVTEGYRPHSNVVVYWNCPKCKSAYDKKINERTSNKEGCPYCAGKRVNRTNCLAVTHENLVKEWDYDKNIDITPNDVTRGSHDKAWWLCEKGHSYKASIARRAGNNGTNCPKCYELYGRRALKKVKRSNSLAIKAPEIAKQWDEFKNGYSSYEIARFSKKEFWWKCEKGHEFKKSPNSRRSNKCKYCI